MAIPVARVHLKVAHAALPALLPTPPKWKMLSQLLPPPPPPCVAAKPSKPPPTKPGRADSEERWDAHKAKTACPALASSASPSSSGPRSPDIFTSSARHGSPPRKNATSPPPPLKPGRADSVERWDKHKKAGIPASSSSSPGTSSSLPSSNKWPISRATLSSDKEHSPPPQNDQRLDDDGESSSTGSADIDTEEEEEEEILWKPRAMYAGPGFAVAAPKSSMIPMPTAFLVPVA